jgi:pimeloyl-ACP methyl ester carboxylesterase
VHVRGDALGRRLSRLGVRGSSDVARFWARFVSLNDGDSRRAFLATSRAVIDPGGQTVDARHRLPAVATVPTLLVWGSHDRLIPSWHGVTAQQAMAGSRVEIFQGAGHFPHLDEPERFAALLEEFIAGTERVSTTG